MRFPRLVLLVVALQALLGRVLVLPASATAAPEACFTETGQCIRGRFLDYWQAHGGLALNGYPLSGERRELLEDGQEYTVQYFERVRMEYHPENPPPYDILLGQFGRRALRTINQLDEAYVTRPHEPRPGAVFFPETAHNVSPRFFEYWQQNGGLAGFGYPLTEELGVWLEDGKIYGVQYFERARFEWHPENDYPYDVLLGQFGRAVLADTDLLAGERDFHLLYLTTTRVQRLLGRPTAPPARSPGAYQGFERGVMLWRSDARRIYVLCEGNQQTGRDVQEFADTWTAGQDPGGGPGPAPGLYQPRFGFGKLWRENPGVRACLGYATAGGETSYTIAVQPFQRATFANLLLAATTPEGRFIYVVYGNYLGGSTCLSFPSVCRPDYERFPNPAP